MTDNQALELRAKMLGAKLRLARLSAGRTLKEAAAYIGTTPGILSAYEANRRSISLPELELLAFHLGVPLRRFWPKGSIETAKGAISPTAFVPLRQRMLSAQVRTDREQAGMTVKQAARAAGIAPARLAAYERGDRPIPLPQLEALAAALGHSIEDYIDRRGAVADWHSSQKMLESLQDLPAELRDFLSEPANRPYLKLAMQMSEVSIEKLRAVAEGLLEITL